VGDAAVDAAPKKAVMLTNANVTRNVVNFLTGVNVLPVLSVGERWSCRTM
jgi:hypothetical protein